MSPRHRKRGKQGGPGGMHEAPEARTASAVIAWLPPLLLIGVGILVYGNALSGPLVYDDRYSIIKNDHIQDLWSLGRALTAPPQAPVAGRPVVSLSLAINYAIGELDVRGYHALNLSVHILGALVLFGIVRRTLLSETLRPRFGQAATGIALACALIWLTHPVQTECINYITQRTESIMGLFYLLTLYCAIRAVDSPHRVRWQAASVVSCALGMASKEVMVTAPVVVVLYDCVFGSGSILDVLRRRRAFYGGLAATWIVLVLMMAPGPRSDTVGFSLGVSALEYGKNQCVMIVQYLRLAFWPDPLVLDYGVPRSLGLGEAAPYGLVLVLTLAATVVALIHRPRLGFLCAWFFIILAPTSSIVPISTEVGAERRMYLPLAGLVVLVVTAGYVLLDRMSNRSGEGSARPPGRRDAGVRRWTGAMLVVILVAGLGWRSRLRNRDYSDTVSIWRTVIAGRPDNPRGYYNLGSALQVRGTRDEAIGYYRRAVELDPGLGKAHYNLAIALQRKGNLDEAVRHYLADLAIRPDHADAHYNLGVALQGQDRLDEAIRHYRRAVQVEPDYGRAHFNLGVALANTGLDREALRHYRDAARCMPDWPAPASRAARILAAHPDMKLRDAGGAVRFAERAATLTRRRDPAVLETLAMAYAAAGRFERAVATAEAAIGLASAAQAGTLVDRLRMELEQYRRSRPYRDQPGPARATDP